MAGDGASTGRWQRWAASWSPVVLVGAAWTVMTINAGSIVATVLFVLLSSVLAMGIARDNGAEVSWLIVLFVAMWLPALMGPLEDAPGPTLVLTGVMAATSPGVRSHLRRSRSHAEVPAELLSDWDLETQWADSLAQLRQAAAPIEQKLALVRRRAELLDELVRRS